VSALTVFVKQQAGKGMSLKEKVAAFKNLSAAEKAPLEKEAAENLEKRNAIRASLKKPASKFALFTKEHFPGEYEKAKQAHPGDRKAAFKAAIAAVAKAYKAQ